MFMHQTWKESRLKLPDDIFEDGDDYVTLPPEFFENLWQPDPYFLNSKVAGKRQYSSKSSRRLHLVTVFIVIIIIAASILRLKSLADWVELFL